MRYWRPILGAIAAAAVGAVVVMMIALTIQTATLADAIRQTQKANTVKAAQNTETLRLIKRVADRVESCTTPGKPCSNRGLRQQAKAVGGLNKVIILAASCAIGVSPKLPVSERENRITICVLNRMTSGH